MKVKELIAWLSAFPDQDADVEVVQHTSGTGYYDQGGNARSEPFDPERHAEYTDLRGNPHVKPDAPWKDARTLMLGELNG